MTVPFETRIEATAKKKRARYTDVMWWLSGAGTWIQTREPLYTATNTCDYLLSGSQDSPAVDLDCKPQHQTRGKQHALCVILCAVHACGVNLLSWLSYIILHAGDLFRACFVQNTVKLFHIEAQLQYWPTQMCPPLSSWHGREGDIKIIIKYPSMENWHMLYSIIFNDYVTHLLCR